MAPLDLLTIILSHKLKYAPGERDMVILSHQVVSVPSVTSTAQYPWPDALAHSSSLVTYGSQGLGSAMSRTVGLPLAFAAMKVLDGNVRERGVRGPSECGREVWGSVLEGMESVGMGMTDTTKRVQRNPLAL